MAFVMVDPVSDGGVETIGRGTRIARLVDTLPAGEKVAVLVSGAAMQAARHGVTREEFGSLVGSLFDFWQSAAGDTL